MEALRGQLQPQVASADSLYPLSDDTVSQFGAVAFAAEVTKIQMTEFSGHDFLSGVGGGLIGEVAVAA